MSQADSILEGDRLALARLLSSLEEDDPEGERTLRSLYPRSGTAHRIGVTGPPGTGKSSLVNRLVRWSRAHRPASVAVVAVDPSSPFTGGAILGDRIRMRDLAGDPGVFVRSMASRGALGGLSRRTEPLVEALDAAGFGTIFVETVGAGQAEVDVARLADTTIVVEAPGLGDDVQAIKAGILEIADVLVVNKSDLPNAHQTERALRASLELAAAPKGGWVPPVILTSAETGEGIDRLMEALEAHRMYLQTSGEGEARRRRRAATRLEAELKASLLARFRSGLPDGRFEAAVAAVRDRRKTPQQAVDELLEPDPGRD
jgi:LAO/AO transport system kinase